MELLLAAFHLDFTMIIVIAFLTLLTFDESYGGFYIKKMIAFIKNQTQSSGDYALTLSERTMLSNHIHAKIDALSCPLLREERARAEREWIEKNARNNVMITNASHQLKAKIRAKLDTNCVLSYR